jgi:hypothetical protein
MISKHQQKDSMTQLTYNMQHNMSRDTLLYTAHSSWPELTDGVRNVNRAGDVVFSDGEPCHPTTSGEPDRYQRERRLRERERKNL